MEVIQSLLTVEQPSKDDDTNAMDVSEPITIGQFAQTNRSTIHLGLNALRSNYCCFSSFILDIFLKLILHIDTLRIAVEEF